MDGVIFQEEWRSRPVNEGQAVDLIEETIRHVRAAGSTKLVWHTGDRVSARFMDWVSAAIAGDLARQRGAELWMMTDPRAMR